jgi:hypothetical protein
VSDNEKRTMSEGYQTYHPKICFLDFQFKTEDKAEKVFIQSGKFHVKL